MANKILGYDLSKWNGNFDFDEAVKKGARFVIIRAGFGKNNIDPKAETYYQQAIAHGLDVGFYWFSYAYSLKMAKNEADFLLRFVKDKYVTYPLIWDYEYSSRDFKFATTPMINGMMRVWGKQIEQAGYYAMFYSNLDYWNNVWSDEIKAKYDCWYARYTKEGYKDIPNVHLWQYSNREKIGGKKTDANYAFINYPAIMKKKGLNHLNG